MVMSSSLHIWLLEPYFGGSHRAWAEGYARYSEHRVELLTLPARFWKWRMQGAAATLAEQARQKNAKPDLILATDMLNLAAFLGLTRHILGNVPTALYCHENQLTYPVPPGENRDLTYGMINWLSMLAADRVFFNSRYHLEDWFSELPRFLKHFPDQSHLHRIPEVKEKASRLPIGCDLRRTDRARKEEREKNEPLILWNQRWEYDKNPQAFFRALDALLARGTEFQVALAGPNFRQEPEEFEAARERLGQRVIHYGWADDATYLRLLGQADVVVSTAIHEFFGIGIVEAIYCKSFPILPKRLVYPEIIPASHHERCLYEDFEGLVDRLQWALTHLERTRQLAEKLQPAAARFDWHEMAPRYDTEMTKVAGATNLLSA